MGTITVKNVSKNTTAEYVNEKSGLIISFNYSEDLSANALQSINGTVYKTENMVYAGNFNGSVKDGEIVYSLSGVKSSDMAAIYEALAEIESLIKQNEGE